MNLNFDQIINIEDYKLPNFPVHIFPEFYQGFIEEVSKELKVSNDMIAMSLLVLFSNIFTKHYQFYSELTDWKLDLNLYVLISARSGANKSGVLNRVSKPFLQYENKMIEKQNIENLAVTNEIGILEKELDFINKSIESNASDEITSERETKLRRISELEKRRIYRTKVMSGNVTTEKLFSVMYENDEKTAIFADEFTELMNILLGKYSNKIDIEILLKAYDATRIDYARAREKQVKVLKKPLLNLLAFSQVNVIRAFQSVDGRGLAERFLFLLPEVKRIRDSDRVDQVLNERYRDNVVKLLKAHEHVKKATQIKLSNDKETVEVFKQLGERIEDEIFNDDVDEAMTSWYSKMLAKLMKISSVMHVLDEHDRNGCVLNTELTKDRIEDCFELLTYFEEHAKKAYGIVREDIRQDDLRYLINKIIYLCREKQSISKTELQQSIKSKYNKEEREKLLNELEERNYIQIIRVERKNLIYLNPTLK